MGPCRLATADRRSPTFVDALLAIARLGPEDWAEDGVCVETAAHLRSVFDSWRTELTQADTV